MWSYGTAMNGWGYVLLAVGTVLLWVIAALVVAALVRDRGPVATGDRAETPEEILADRFARGRIDEEEYRTRLQILREQPPVGS
ncbi:hypothetical protein GCM10010210_10490 [Pseudonocardia hydrocarbonoxydans]|uniref:SHOCT domain-containing protein n=2 Tax=Pseudonocardia hydrocarbonoxydans TaxID=76726 RepID=A0A4Y3WR24_9PSEU|nr:hypothetical protein PHY01_36160 [Pseudonocardia hydrocarbonoxydans]